jgi:hypothetical protein
MTPPPPASLLVVPAMSPGERLVISEYLRGHPVGRVRRTSRIFSTARHYVQPFTSERIGSQTVRSDDPIGFRTNSRYLATDLKMVHNML